MRRTRRTDAATIATVLLGLALLGVAGSAAASPGTATGVQKDDFDGDGAPDIRFSNGKAWGRVTSQDLTRDAESVYLDEVGRQRWTDLDDPVGWGIRSRAPCGNLDSLSVSSLDPYQDATGTVGYDAVVDGEICDNDVEIRYKVRLQPGEPGFAVTVTLENQGSDDLALDHPGGHIHDGNRIGNTAGLRSPDGTERFYLEGEGVVAKDTCDRWRTWSGSGDFPLYAVYGDENAIGFQVADGTSGFKQAITEETPCRITLLAQEETLEPGEAAEHRIALALADGGSGSVDRLETAVEDVLSGDRAPTRVEAEPVIDTGYWSAPDSTAPRLRAQVTSQPDGQGLAGVDVFFRTPSGKPLCEDTTNGQGVAECIPKESGVESPGWTEFTAVFRGTDAYLPSRDKAPLASQPGSPSRDGCREGTAAVACPFLFDPASPREATWDTCRTAFSRAVCELVPDHDPPGLEDAGSAP